MLKSLAQILLMLLLLISSSASAFISTDKLAVNRVQTSSILMSDFEKSEAVEEKSQTTSKMAIDALFQNLTDGFSLPTQTNINNQAFFFKNHNQANPFYVFKKFLDPPDVNKRRFDTYVSKPESPVYTLKSSSTSSRLANWKDSNLLYTGCITYA